MLGAVSFSSYPVLQIGIRTNESGLLELRPHGVRDPHAYVPRIFVSFITLIRCFDKSKVMSGVLCITFPIISKTGLQ